MKKIATILFTFLLSGCSFFLYRESYTLDRYARWINSKTKEEVSDRDFGFCAQKATLEIMGRNVDDNENIGLDNFYKRYPILGKCLYEKGYVFKIDNPIVYCYARKEECNAFKNYIKLL